jgi:3-hydroxyacyl-CoA dehydrogenase
MRFVEIVGGTPRPETVATAQASRRLGKVGVVVGNCAGFVGNRMMFPYMYEAQFLVEDGATPQQVDEALTGFGMAMGIFAVDDMGGLTWHGACAGAASVQRAGGRSARARSGEMGRLGRNRQAKLRRRPRRSPI